MFLVSNCIVVTLKRKIFYKEPFIFKKIVLSIEPTNAIIKLINIIFKISPIASTKSCFYTCSTVIHPKFIAFWIKVNT